jgi:DNA-binding transcriptional MerR regulator/quercetin dioxygenase-like cupin family protein
MVEASRDPDPLPGRRRELGYTVGDAARIAGISPTTVRVWERQGLVSSRRSPSGYRYFGEEELSRLRRIAYLRGTERLNGAAIHRVLAEESGRSPRPRSRNEIPVGLRLRRLRQQRGMTLEQAATAAGLSASFLSSVERDQTGISPASLHKLADTYGATLTSIMRRAAPRLAQLKRLDSRRAIRNHGVTMEQMVDGQTMMDPSIFTVEPGAGSGGSYSHAGEEFVYMLQGSLEIVLGVGERYTLKAGESLYYPSTIEHRWRNPGTELAQALWVNTPPTF